MPGDIPREQTQAFLDAFARMPQRVLARMVLSGMPYATQSQKWCHHKNEFKFFQMTTMCLKTSW